MSVMGGPKKTDERSMAFGSSTEKAIPSKPRPKGHMASATFVLRDDHTQRYRSYPMSYTEKSIPRRLRPKGSATSATANGHAGPPRPPSHFATIPEGAVGQNGLPISKSMGAAASLQVSVSHHEGWATSQCAGVHALVNIVHPRNFCARVRTPSLPACCSCARQHPLCANTCAHPCKPPLALVHASRVCNLHSPCCRIHSEVVERWAQVVGDMVRAPCTDQSLDLLPPMALFVGIAASRHDTHEEQGSKHRSSNSSEQCCKHTAKYCSGCKASNKQPQNGKGGS
eukprot:581331-Pelagomonas_calceolata.AAC.2